MASVPAPEDLSPGAADPPDAPTIAPPDAGLGADAPTMPPLVAEDLADHPTATGTAAVPGFELLGELGRGGMGVVYKARQAGLGRTVALKMVLHAGHAGAELLARFRAEAQAVAALQHPNVVQVYELGEHGGAPYFALEFVPGGSLDRKLAGTPLPPREAAALVAQVARGVAAAHAAGIIHRDLKPANVLLAPDGTPKVTDFGLAKQLDGDAGQTKSGAVMGTPSYMAPEQAEGKKVGPLADVYALGAILYECLTGRPPFKAATAVDTIMQVVSDEPAPPSQLQGQTPRDLETVCLKCLQKDPAKRYATAAALAEDLQRWLDGVPIAARRIGRLERSWRWCRRNPVVAGLTVMVAGLVVAVAVVALIGLILVLAALDQSDEYRRDAEAQASQATEARRRADDKAAAAEANARATRAALERSDVANGLRLMDDGDLFGAMAWFAKPLQGDYGPVAPEAANRYRLALTWRFTPRPTLTQILPHQGMVVTAAFSSDGRQVLTAGADRIARVWDTATGEPVTPPMLHQGEVRQAVFSPDGLRVATCGLDAVARVWDAASGRPLIPPIQHPTPVTHLEFGPDGRRLLTVAVTARVWDAASGQPLTPPFPHPTLVSSATFSPDGRRLVTACADGTARVWDAVTGRSLAPPVKHGFVLYSATFSPNGRHILTAGWASGRVWDATTGQPITPPLVHQGRVVAARFSPDGTRLVTASEDRTARVWDALTGNPVGLPLQHHAPVYLAAFSPDGRRVVTASLDRSARVWDAATGRALSPPLPHPGEVAHAAFGPDGRHLVSTSASAQEGEARVWDLASLLSHPEAGWTRTPVTRVAHSADGRRVFAAWNQEGRVWDVATRQPLSPPLSFPEGIDQVGFSPDGERLLVAGSDSAVRVLDSATGQSLPPVFQHPDTVAHVCSSQDGRRLLTTCEDGGARVWDLQNGQPIGHPFPHRQKAWPARFSPDGRLILTAHEENAVQVWDAATGQPLPGPLRHRDQVTCTAFSSDGRRVVTASRDNSARVWEAATGRPVTPPLAHQHWVQQAAFSPDGQLVATASEDRTARVWDAATGQAIAQPMSHLEGIRAVAFSPDGRWILTGSGDKTARLWEVASGLPVSPPLGHPYWVKHAAFSSDGRLAVTVTDLSVHAWDLTPDLRAANDWLRLARVLHGGLDRLGGRVLLPQHQVLKEWTSLRAQFSAEFGISPAAARAWREGQIADCMGEGNLTAALFHRDWLIAELVQQAAGQRQPAGK